MNQPVHQPVHQPVRHLAVLAVALLGSALLGAAPPSVAAGRVAPPPVLEPRDLPRGADVRVPHVVGSTFVDGDRRVEVEAGRVGLLGASGEAFLLRTSNEDGTRGSRVLRLLPDGTTEVLLRGRDTWSTFLTHDGSRLVQSLSTSRRGRPATTRVSAWNARTGRLVARQRLRGYASVLDATRRRAVVTDDDRTFWLDLRTGGRNPIVARRAGAVDVSTGRLAAYTGDPYQDGCTVVSTLQRPRRATWRSCRERVDSFSPDGTHMATIDLLADGIGPGTVWLREVDGTLLERWSTGWFGMIDWESDRTLLMEANGRRSSAVVRCGTEGCENATDPGPVPRLRPVG